VLELTIEKCKGESYVDDDLLYDLACHVGHHFSLAGWQLDPGLAQSP
jgi:hypothetical protein